MAEPTMKKRLILPSAIVAGLILCAIIGWMIESRAQILRDGTEIVLKSEPIDPRDLLRGRYVILTYPAARLTGPLVATLVADLEPEETRQDVKIYVTLEEDDEGYHQPAAVSFVPPDEGIFVVATTRFLQAGLTAVWVDYGIGRFYTNEHRAPEIEQRMRDGELTEIVVAVSADGTAHIKALRQAGETIATEQLY